MMAGTLASDPHARRRLVVAVIGTVALLALVAAGSGAFRSNGSGIAVRDSAVVLDATAAIAAAIATAAVIFGVVLLRFSALRHPNERSVSRQLLTMLIMIAIVALTAIAIRHLHQVGGTPARSGTHAASPSRSPEGRGQPIPGRGADWWVIALAVGITASAILVWSVRSRRRIGNDGGDPDTNTRSQVLQVLDDSLADLIAEGDNRRAVIAAYARMERLLANVGAPRAPAETPFEYLDRVLVSFGASAAVAQPLTELFEHAKFSHHPVDGAMKQQAVDALTELRDELRSAA
jgi:hypothetical protein